MDLCVKNQMIFPSYSSEYGIICIFTLQYYILYCLVVGAQPRIKPSGHCQFLLSAEPTRSTTITAVSASCRQGPRAFVWSRAVLLVVANSIITINRRSSQMRCEVHYCRALQLCWLTIDRPNSTIYNSYFLLVCIDCWVDIHTRWKTLTRSYNDLPRSPLLPGFVDRYNQPPEQPRQQRKETANAINANQIFFRWHGGLFRHPRCSRPYLARWERNDAKTNQEMDQSEDL